MPYSHITISRLTNKEDFIYPAHPLQRLSTPRLLSHPGTRIPVKHHQVKLEVHINKPLPCGPRGSRFSPNKATPLLDISTVASSICRSMGKRAENAKAELPSQPSPTPKQAPSSIAEHFKNAQQALDSILYKKKGTN
jgi:hypothetical protein